MPNDDLYRCRVCGLTLQEPPWGLDGRTPLFENCPCCGVEWGYQDATIEGSRKYRQQWLDQGSRWDDPSRKPHDWSLEEQLKDIPTGFR